MQEFVTFMVRLMRELVSSIWNAVYLDIGGYRVSYFWFILGMLAIGMVVSVFWKGAKS